MIDYETYSVFWTLLNIVQGFSPVVGMSILLLEIRSNAWFLKFVKTSLFIAGIGYFIVGKMASPKFPVTEQVFLYCITVSVFIHFLMIKNPDKTDKVLGVTLIVANLFSQYWEIPLFILAHLGVSCFEYLGSIDQAYLLLIFCLAIKFTNISISKKDIMILSAPLIFTTLAFYSNPIVFIYMTPLWYLVRCFSCLCLGKFFIQRGVL